LQGNIPAVSEARAELPRELVAIVAQATARLPRERFQRATDMIDALSAVLRKQPAATDATAIARSVRAARAWGSSQHPPAATQPPPGATQPPPGATKPPIGGTPPPPPATQPPPSGTQPPPAAD
jgi:hypothetical protein